MLSSCCLMCVWRKELVGIALTSDGVVHVILFYPFDEAGLVAHVNRLCMKVVKMS